MARKFASLRRLALSQGGAATSLAAIAAGVQLSGAARSLGAGGVSTGADQLGGLGGLIGGGIGLAFGQPFVGSAIGSSLLSPLGSYISGGYQLQGQMLALQAAGISPGIAQGIGLGIDPAGGNSWFAGGMRGLEGMLGIGLPWTGRIGAQGGGQIAGAFSPFLAGGVSEAAIGMMGSGLSGLYGTQGAIGVGGALAPFASNPVFAAGLAGVNGGLGFGGGGVPFGGSDITGMVLAGGGPATVAALANHPRLRSVAENVYATLQRADFSIAGAQAGATLAESGLTGARASGAAPGSSEINSAFSGAISAVQEFASTLRAKAADIQGNNPYSVQARAELTAQASAADAQAAMLGFQNRNEAAAFSIAGLSSSATVAMGAFGRERMGLATGAVAPSLATAGVFYRRLEDQASAYAADSSLDPSARLRYRQTADAAETAIYGLRRERVAEAQGAPAAVAQGFTGRLTAGVFQEAAFGMGEDALAGGYGSAYASAGRTMGRQSALIAAMERSGVYSGPEIEAQKVALTQTRLQQNTLGRSLAYNASDFEILAGQQALSVGGVRAGFLGLLGGGSLADVGIAGGMADLMTTMAGSLRSRAGIARGRGEERYASELESQADVMGYQARSATAAVYASAYRPSAASSVSLGNADLAEQLAANDIGTGGFVPVGLRRARMSTMAQQLGQIDAYVAGAPANLRDQAAASSMGLRNSLVLAMQQDENALQYGEIGHLINVGVGQPGNFTLRAANIGDWQRMNPGGTKALGGSGAALDASPFSGMMGGAMSAGSLAQALGGSGGGTGVIEDLLRQLIAAVQQNGTGGTGAAGVTFGMRDLTKDPREQARQNSPVR